MATMATLLAGPVCEEGQLNAVMVTIVSFNNKLCITYN